MWGTVVGLLWGINMRKLEEYDYNAAAAILDCEVAAVKAVTKVESRGSGFLPTGEPIILFERHWMYKLLKQAGKPTPLSDICNPKAGGYKGGAAEHLRLAEAVKLDRDCALQSCSWGLFQIMGFHWKSLNYGSLQQFINAQYKDEGSQLETFVRFILVNPNLHKALKNKDWVKFAAGYNGPNYKVNDYDNKLMRAYNEVK